MDGSRLLGGRLPINLSSPLVRKTAFNPLSPITSWAEVNACRTSELIIIASSLLLMLSPRCLTIKGIAILKQVYRKYTRDIAPQSVRTPCVDTNSMKPDYHFAYLRKVLRFPGG